MDHLKRARNIIEKRLKAEIRSIHCPESGSYNEVFIAETSKGDVVIRFSTEDKYSMKAHIYALKKWAGLKIPVPKVILAGRDFVVETRIEGSDWRHSRLNKDQTREALKTLGKLLKKMHSVRTKGFGYIIKPGQGQYKTWREFMGYYLKLRMEKIKGLNFLKKGDIQKIIGYFNDNDDLLDFKEPRLCHKDVNKGNIMIHEGRISGIIDASDAISGDPMFDVGIIYQRFTSEFEHFAKAYGKIDMRKARYYAVINALRKIPLDHKKGNLEACARHFKQIEGIINMHAVTT